jgi:hypothetical protein
MTQLNDEHFEVIEKNKIERYERQKLTYLEDRVKVLETALESHAKILARFQMTEDKKELAELDDIEIYESFDKAENNVNPYSEEDFEIDLTPDEKEVTHEQ